METEKWLPTLPYIKVVNKMKVNFRTIEFYGYWLFLIEMAI